MRLTVRVLGLTLLDLEVSDTDDDGNFDAEITELLMREPIPASACTKET